ncbi:MAG: hypothetical protein AB1700_17800 [Bacillota bacterium]
MRKTVVTKEDGRYLIYYSFAEGCEPLDEEAPTEEAGAPAEPGRARARPMNEGERRPDGETPGVGGADGAVLSVNGRAGLNVRELWEETISTSSRRLSVAGNV